MLTSPSLYFALLSEIIEKIIKTWKLKINIFPEKNGAFEKPCKNTIAPTFDYASILQVNQIENFLLEFIRQRINNFLVNKHCENGIALRKDNIS